MHLFPTNYHPSGAHDDPWFLLIADLVFPSEHHPSGIYGFPWFEREGNLLYPAYGNPEFREGDGPCFLIRGEYFYQLESDLPWFRIKRPGATAERESLLERLATKMTMP